MLATAPIAPKQSLSPRLLTSLLGPINVAARLLVCALAAGCAPRVTLSSPLVSANPSATPLELDLELCLVPVSRYYLAYKSRCCADGL